MGNSSSHTTSTESSTSLKNQNSSSTIHSHTSSNSKRNNNNKQSKKWKIAKKMSSKKGSTSSIDLSVTQPDITEYPIMSWNCQHKLAEIRKTVSLLQAHVINQKQSKKLIMSESPSMMTEQESFTFLWSELGNIANDITKTIHGVTHNALDRLPNELALLDYWMKIACKFQEYAVIVFEINEIEKIREHLGWESADQIIVKTGEKIQEYCDWYQNDYDSEFKLFHCDFKVEQFIVVCHCADSRVIADLCDCTMVDVSRSVKCFFQETVLWAGFVNIKKNKQKRKKTHKKYHSKKNNKLIGRNDDELDLDSFVDPRYQFQVLYQRANMALKLAMNKAKYSHKTSDRIMKWMPKQDRMEKGHSVMRVLHEYYVQSCSGGSNRNRKKHKSLDDVIEAIHNLIKDGADLNYQDSAGNTPFFYSLSLEQP